MLVSVKGFVFCKGVFTTQWLRHLIAIGIDLKF